jgi:ABC-type Mn2+/Zn2+ transport system permease subunit
MTTMIETLAEAFRYDFVWRALTAGSLIAVSCSLLGIFLVLRKYSLIGDGLAHVSFAAAALSILLSASPLLVTIPFVVLASFGILALNERAGIHGDAAIGLVSSFSVALGVIIASLAKGFNVDLMSYLFGSILVISSLDVAVSVTLSVVIIATVFVFYKSLFAISYDEEYARVIGIPVKRINYLIIVLTAVTISLGIRVVGTMLVSSLIIFPAVTALQTAKSFRGAILTATVISMSCVIAGVLVSYLFNLPTGGTIVVLNAICFIVFFARRKLFLVR